MGVAIHICDKVHSFITFNSFLIVVHGLLRFMIGVKGEEGETGDY